MLRKVSLLLFIGLAGFLIEAKSLPCSQVQKDHGIVCRCNATYCDTIEPLGTVTAGKAVVYTTSRKGKRMERSELKHSTSSSAKTKVYVNGTQTFQQIMGFGAAFTDAAGINMKMLPQAMQDQIIEQYFSDDGLGYVFGRVPMASTDFSTHEYSYDDVKLDFLLTNFNLTIEDFDYKIPFIKKAMTASGGKLKLFATPWSSPGWMKTSGRMVGAGELIGDQNGKYYQTWAQYFVKFFEAYHAQGIDFWSLTPQNEPTTGIDPLWKWQTLYFDASMERNFIKKLLGPALAASSVTKNLKIMINDDQRINLPHWPKVILSDPNAAQYVHGIALHWYEDFIDPATVIAETHALYPDYFLLATEACAGYFPADGPKLGSWSRAEQYANDLIKDIGNWVGGWVDWNYILDLQGGPNLAKNFVDSTLIVNATAQEYYKQPIWHVMAQFSKFVKPGSTRIGTTIIEKAVDVEGLSFLNADGTKTVVLLNKNEVLDFEVAVSDISAPNVIYDLTIQANSLSIEAIEPDIVCLLKKKHVDGEVAEKLLYQFSNDPDFSSFVRECTLRKRTQRGHYDSLCRSFQNYKNAKNAAATLKKVKQIVVTKWNEETDCVLTGNKTTFENWATANNTKEETICFLFGTSDENASSCHSLVLSKQTALINPEIKRYEGNVHFFNDHHVEYSDAYRSIEELVPLLNQCSTVYLEFSTCFQPEMALIMLWDVPRLQVRDDNEKEKIRGLFHEQKIA